MCHLPSTFLVIFNITIINHSLVWIRIKGMTQSFQIWFMIWFIYLLRKTNQNKHSFTNCPRMIIPKQGQKMREWKYFVESRILHETGHPSSWTKPQEILTSSVCRISIVPCVVMSIMQLWPHLPLPIWTSSADSKAEIWKGSTFFKIQNFIAIFKFSIKMQKSTNKPSVGAVVFEIVPWILSYILRQKLQILNLT